MALLGSETTGREKAPTGRPPERERGVESTTHSTTFRFARLAFGGVMAVMALDNFMNLEERIGYAESNGVPMPEVSVPFASGALFFGGMGIAFWKLPTLAAGAILTFFAGVTPEMHKFWEMEGEQKQQQMVHFLKNTALFGAGLAFLRIAMRSRSESKSQSRSR